MGAVQDNQTTTLERLFEDPFLPAKPVVTVGSHELVAHQNSSSESHYELAVNRQRLIAQDITCWKARYSTA
jgi:hypothetical protein